MLLIKAFIFIENNLFFILFISDISDQNKYKKIHLNHIMIVGDY
jgi:hypothetical protein